MTTATLTVTGLSNLRALLKAKKRGQSQRELNRTIRKRNKPQMSATKARKRLSTSNKVWRKVQPGTGRCLACGKSGAGEDQARIVFALLNGHEGTIEGALCAHHKAGDSWRDVGIIKMIGNKGAEEPVSYTVREYAQDQGISLTTARKRLNKLVSNGDATIDKSGKPYRYIMLDQA